MTVFPVPDGISSAQWPRSSQWGTEGEEEKEESGGREGGGVRGGIEFIKLHYHVVWVWLVMIVIITSKQDGYCVESGSEQHCTP